MLLQIPSDAFECQLCFSCAEIAHIHLLIVTRASERSRHKVKAFRVVGSAALHATLQFICSWKRLWTASTRLTDTNPGPREFELTVSLPFSGTRQ